MVRALRLFAALCLIVSSSLAAVLVAAVPAHAAPPGQLGTPQVTLNPGGGVNPDGSDGLRFTVNSDPVDAWLSGYDRLRFRDTRQYCCSAGGPMLNVGGTLFAQAGPAAYYDVVAWDSLTILSTSGSAAVGEMTTATGNASARVRYTAVKNGLEYVVDRTVTYVYPNDFVTDTYEFTIPDGNTEQVKFYLGGDTAPGGTDQGYGVMLTSPVRSVISLNPGSGIYFGFREAAGSKPFDGATSRDFIDPYSAVVSGGDIGFVSQEGQHDAGLMMQWTLGSTPGTQTAALQQFVSQQGTNLTAGFDREFTDPGEPVVLNMSIENTQFITRSGLGYTIQLPEGSTVATGSQQNTCAGELSAPVGATSVTLTGGAVDATANCVVSVPVVATEFGTYTMSAANVTSITGLTNNVGTSFFFVPLAPEFTVTELGPLTVGVPTTQSIAADGAPPPTYEVTSGTLPDGLDLDEETGEITGTPTTAGPYEFTVTATNSGGSDTQTYTGTVQRGTPGLSATATPASATYGEQVTLEVHDLPQSATGSVAFASGDTGLCTVTLPDTTCDTPDDLLPDDYPVQAAYSGDGNWLPRTLAVTTFEITPAGTTVTGSLSQAETEYGTPVTVTGEVTPADAEGTIEVSSGGATLCTIEIPDTTCQTPATLAPGSYSIALTYSGEPPRYLGSSGLAGTLVVERAAPGPDPLDPTVGVYGEDIVVELPGLPDDATGTVTFSVDGTELCSYELGDDPESCVIEAGLPAGSYEMTVDYSGDDNYEPAERTVELIIDPASTSISAPEELSSVYGSAAVVEVSGIPADATGDVEVAFAGEELCTFDAADETSCALPADLPAGGYDLLVTYGGDDNHLGSDTLVALTVEKAGTAITAPETVETERNVPVEIEIGDIPEDATGVVTVSGGPLGVECAFDVAEAAGCETTGLTPPGSWELTAAYSGDGNYEGSEAELALVVLRDPTEVQADDVSTVYGFPATLVVSGLPADATGDVAVTREESGEEIEECVFPAATTDRCDLEAGIPAGEHGLTVTYAGDDNYEGSSAQATLTVEQAPTAISTADEITAIEGSPAAVVVYGVPPEASGTVTVTLDNILARALAPGAALCSFDVTETDFCLTPDTLAVGRYTLAVSYSGDDNHAGSVTTAELEVVAKEDDADPDDDEDPDDDSDEEDGDRDDDRDDEDGDDSLPDTGTVVIWTLVVGAGLLAAGAAALRARRQS